MHRASFPLVFAGGAIGAVLRVLALALPLDWSGPFALLAVNVLGAFLLGLVTASIRHEAVPEPVTRLRERDHGAVAREATEQTGLITASIRHEAVRLLLGTGLLGGFTSYSAMVAFAQPGDGFWHGLGLAFITLVVGTAAAAIGLRIGAHRKSSGQDPAQSGSSQPRPPLPRSDRPSSADAAGRA
jgi:CrcB protein